MLEMLSWARTKALIPGITPDPSFTLILFLWDEWNKNRWHHTPWVIFLAGDNQQCFLLYLNVLWGLTEHRYKKNMLRSDSFFDIGTQMTSLRMRVNFFMLFLGLIFFEINIWAATWDFQQCSMWDQQSLRSACAYAHSDHSLCLSLEYSMGAKLLTKHYLEFLNLKGGCKGLSESTLVKMPHCWKSHVTA